MRSTQVPFDAFGREDFEVTLESGDAARSVIIRATDAMNNVATAVADVKR